MDASHAVRTSCTGYARGAVMPKKARRGGKYTVRVNRGGSQEYKRVPFCGWIVYLPLAVGGSLAMYEAVKFL